MLKKTLLINMVINYFIIITAIDLFPIIAYIDKERSVQDGSKE